MPWNTVAPLGTVSVKANRTILQQNTTYIETTMGNSVVGTNAVTTRDHFWNVGSDEDGRHRFIQSPAFTVGGLPVDPVVGTGMDSVAYSKLKLAAEAVAQQDVQPFYRNASAIMQMLGMRACAVFDSTGVIAYSHNVSSVVRSATGRYTITFTSALPSVNYLVSGGAMRSDSGGTLPTIVSVASGATLASSKTAASLKIVTSSRSGSLLNPIQTWVMCYGG